MERSGREIEVVARDFLRAVLNRPSGMQSLEFLENNILGMLQGRTFNRIHQEFNALYDGHITIDDAIKNIYWINYQSYFNSLDGFVFLRKHLLEFKTGTIGHFFSKNLFSDFNQGFKSPEERNKFIKKLVGYWHDKIFARQLDGTIDIKDRVIPVYKQKPFYKRKIILGKGRHNLEIESRVKVDGYRNVMEQVARLRKIEKVVPFNEMRLDDELERLYSSIARLIRNLSEVKRKFSGKEKWNAQILDSLNQEIYLCWEFLKRSGYSVALASGSEVEASIDITDYQLREINRKINNIEAIDDLPGVFQDIFVLDFRYFILLKNRHEAKDQKHCNRINKYSINNKVILDNLVNKLESKLYDTLGSKYNTIIEYYIKYIREFIRITINRIQYSSVDSKFSEVLGKLTGDLSLKRGSKQTEKTFEEDEAVKNIIELGKELRKILAQKGYLKLANYIFEWKDDELARGGQGAVTFGFNPKSQSLVVLKRPLLQAKSSEQIEKIVRRMKNEADINKELKHRHIIFCGGIYEDAHKTDKQGRHAIIQEFFPGEDLLDILKKNYKAHMMGHENDLIRWIHVKEFWLQALGAISAMRNKGITHRDLKPDNFMVLFNSDPVGDENYLIAKLTDFGSAVKGTEVSGISLSYPYHSPEHLRGLGIKDLDDDEKVRVVPGKTDTYSLGEIIFEIFCGLHPFKAVFRNLMENARKKAPQGQSEILIYFGAHSEFYRRIIKKAGEGIHPQLKDYNRSIVGQIGQEAYDDLNWLLKSMRAYYPDDRPDADRMIENVEKFFDEYFIGKRLKEPVLYQVKKEAEQVAEGGATVTMACDEVTRTVTGDIIDVW